MSCFKMPSIFQRDTCNNSNSEWVKDNEPSESDNDTQETTVEVAVTVHCDLEFWNQERLFTGLGVRVGGFMGGQSPPGGLGLISIAVCTIEKANGLINRLIEEGRLDELGLVIVDELHLIGDSHRGYLLELLLTKLLVYSRRVQESDSAVTSGTPAVCEKSDSSLVDEVYQCARSFRGIQLIGMSATLPNLAQLGEWLDAAVYATDYRPVPLTELVFTRDPKNSVSHAYAVVPSKLTPSRALRGGTGEPSELLEPVASPVLDSQLSTEMQLSVTDEDGVFGLCLDTLLSGHGVLVFCPTKQWCEQLADTMARHIFRLTKEHFAEKEHSSGPNTHSPDDCPTKVEDPSIGTRLATCLNRTRLASCVEQLKRCPSGLDPGLARCLGYAVAFHHAGLTVEEREIVENGFRAGFVRILVATSTLSSGVNLPARRVIIRTPLFHGQILDYLNYKQMAGRAGRKGVDTSGQSILLCKPRDLPRVRLMIRQGMPPVTSCLMGHGFSTESSLRRAVLEVVANGFVETVADARLYLSSTLMMVCFSQSADGNRFASPSARKTPRRMSHSRHSLSNGSPIRADVSPGDSSSNHLLELCISSLREHELLYIDSSPCSNFNCSDCRAQSEIGSQPSSVISKLQDCARLYPTALGRAVLSSSLGPVHGLVVFEELSKAQRAIALDTELHLIYLLTPVYLDVGAGLDWFRYLEQYQSLSPANRRVADLIGIEERFITRCAAGASSTKHSTASSGDGRLGRHRRFYTALALYRLVCEDELSTVAERFGLNRGLLQSLQQQAATYAGMVTIFCNRLGWVHMERLVANFQSRLFYGVSEELVDLVRLLPLVNVQRARALYSSGYTSVSALTNAKPRDIARILQRAVPFRSTDPDVEDFSKRGTIQLDDGTWVSEEEAAPLIVIKAQELLRSDLVGVYGTNVIILPTTTDSKVDPVESDAVNSCSVVISPVPLDEPAKDTSSPNSGLMQSSSLRPPLPVVQSAPDHGQTTSLLHHSLSSSDYEGVSEKRVRLSKSPCPSPSCNPCNHSESLRTSPLPLTDACAGTGQSTYPKYPVVEQITETVTPSKDENRSSPMQSGNYLSSQINDTFVLTTQIAALMDHASVLPQPEKPILTKCSPPFSFQPENEWKIQSSTTPKALHPSACDPVKDLLVTDRASDSPISATTVCLMNDTLTFSMLDDALESEPPTVQPSNKPILSPLRRIKKSQIATAGVSPSTPTPTSESKLHAGMSSTTNPLALPMPPPSPALSSPPPEATVIFESQLSSDSPISNSLTPTNDVNLSSDSILCVIDVTRQKSLWQIFMEEFLMQLHYHGESGPASRAIAIQPCWVISSLEVDEINFPLAWHSGPAGSARLGGGVEMHSAKHPLRLTLRGFAISSSLLHPKAVFWIGLNDGHLSALYLDGIRKLLRELQLTNHTLVVWDSKWWFRLVQDVLDIPVTESPPVLDPGILGWLYDPDQGRPKLVSEVAKFGLEMQNLVAQLEALDLVREPPGQHSDWTHLVSSLSDINDSGDTSCPPSRLVEFPCSPDVPGFITVAAIQCFLLSKWTDSKLFCLSKVPKILVTLEIPCHALLAKLESTGFVLDISLLRECHASLLLSCKILEKVAYRLAGQNFQLDSPREVSKILFNELRLPQLTDNSDCIAAKKRSRVSLFSNARFRSRAADHLPRATNALLLRLSGLHPLPSVVIEWRHLHFLLEKTFASLMTHCEALVKQRIDCKNDLSKCNHLRISPTYDVCTATGRIVSCVPNIQAVPNDITIDFPALLVRPTSSSLTSLLGKTHEPQISDLSSSIWPDAISEALSDVPKEVKIIRPREAFCASLGGLLISGDFCQLELRLLAHFSRDEHLLELLSAADSANVIRDSAMPPPPSADAFRRLASYWLKIPNPTMVTSAQRQQAKQLCYALVYGMGAQGLAAQLDVTEQTAQSLIDSFLRTYPGVQRFITETVQGAHRHGYVSTLGGRIRLLPVLKENSVNSDDSPNPFAGSTAAYGHGVEARRFFAISKAERQAVNTVIQGSAAEIAKMAMLSVDSVLTANVSEGRCQLVLHEHDELVYEVHPADAGAKFGSLIRHTMSSVCQKCNLSVQLPVKLRAGPNWADLEEVLW